MARTIDEIKKEVTDNFIQNEEIKTRYELEEGKSFDEQFSAVSLENILFSVMAICLWTLEKLFDLHKEEVLSIIKEMKPHSLRWYMNKAKAFQYGDELYAEEDFYDNTGKTAEQVAASKIVSYTAVVEHERGLRIKVAKTNGNQLAPLTQGLVGESSNELQAFKEYMKRIKDAGVRLLITTDEADKLKLKLKIYYDPLILNNNGQRLDGTDSEPVQKAVRNYLKNLPFNGYVVQTYLVDALQKVDGIVVPVIENIETKFGTYGFAQMAEIYNPDAGYMVIDEDDFESITFIPQTVIN